MRYKKKNKSRLVITFLISIMLIGNAGLLQIVQAERFTLVVIVSDTSIEVGQSITVTWTQPTEAQLDSPDVAYYGISSRLYMRVVGATTWYLKFNGNKGSDPILIQIDVPGEYEFKVDIIATSFAIKNLGRFYDNTVVCRTALSDIVTVDLPDIDPIPVQVLASHTTLSMGESIEISWDLSNINDGDITYTGISSHLYMMNEAMGGVWTHLSTKTGATSFSHIEPLYYAGTYHFQVMVTANSMTFTISGGIYTQELDASDIIGYGMSNPVTIVTIPYANDLAYTMVNVPKAHQWLQTNSYFQTDRPGEGVTVAIIDTGITPHPTLMYKPDGTLRQIWHIDINGYWYSLPRSYYDGSYNPNVYYNFNVHHSCISTISEWTHNYDSSTKQLYNPYPMLAENSDLDMYGGPKTQVVGVGDYYGHGTKVLGAFLRIAPYANFIIVDVEDAILDNEDKPQYVNSNTLYSDGYYYNRHYMDQSILKGLEELTYFDPDIISCSFGSYEANANDIEIVQNFISELNSLTEELTTDGTTLIFAASGNDADQMPPHYPSDFDHVISVGSINTLDQLNPYVRSIFSNYGPQLEVTAPGCFVFMPKEVYTDDKSDVLATELQIQWTESAGTSFSTPIVAGEAALLYQFYKGTHNNQKPQAAILRDIIHQGCDPGGEKVDPDDTDRITTRQNDEYGYGIIDCWEALQYLLD